MRGVMSADLSVLNSTDELVSVERTAPLRDDRFRNLLCAHVNQLSKWQESDSERRADRMIDRFAVFDDDDEWLGCVFAHQLCEILSFVPELVELGRPPTRWPKVPARRFPDRKAHDLAYKDAVIGGIRFGRALRRGRGVGGDHRRLSGRLGVVDALASGQSSRQEKQAAAKGDVPHARNAMLGGSRVQGIPVYLDASIEDPNEVCEKAEMSHNMSSCLADCSGSNRHPMRYRIFPRAHARA